MRSQNRIDARSDQYVASGLLDVLIRAGLILALAMLCYRVFAPFLSQRGADSFSEGCSRLAP